MGIAGERGAEAIMPLSRGPDGRLGVAVPRSAGAQITFNVTATDAESFRRSESQISAMLARAAALGQRNL
jgi:phage-related minor tail protein